MIDDPDPCDPLTYTDPPEELDLMQSTWTAKYHTQCVSCPTKISPGDECVWEGDAPAHAVCPDPEALDLTAAYGVCGVCFMALPASRVCGVC